MSGVDDLRDAIACALCPTSRPGETCDAECPFLPQADAVLAVLGDPVRRLALLELVGDVREGYGQEDEEGIWQIGRVEALRDDGDHHVFVVRPRGGAADG